MEFSGSTHTWSRGNSVDTWQSAQLDRPLCNGEWSLRFANASAKNLPAIQSDHCPVLISPNGFAPLASINRPFRFQASWLTHEKFNDFVNQSWDKSAPWVPQLHALASKLQDWNHHTFHNIFKQKRTYMARIAGARRCLALSKSRDLIKLEAKLRKELNEIIAQEELLWYQKSRVDWLRDGDRNTSYFHLSTIARRWRNKISAIKDSPSEYGSMIMKMLNIILSITSTPFSWMKEVWKMSSFQLIFYRSSPMPTGCTSLDPAQSVRLKQWSKIWGL